MTIAQSGFASGSWTLLVGIALILLTGLASTLSYILRSYSKSRLAKYLGEPAAAIWLPRLDAYDARLLLDASFLRLAGNLGIVFWVVTAVHGETLEPSNSRGLILPALTALLSLSVVSIGLPAALAAHAGEPILARSLALLWALHYALLPVETVLVWLDRAVGWSIGKPREPLDVEHRAEQEILEAVDAGRLRGAVLEEQREMIRSVLELNDTPVSAIMTPRTDVIAISADATFEQARAMILDQGHSRVPVYEDTLDHIVGVLYAKDLLRVEPGAPFALRERMRKAPFVPESKTIDELLNEFRQSKVQIAIVLDEYGGTVGLATIEDILEELVGEIDDEYDEPAAPTVQRIDADTLEVDGRVPVYEVNQELRIELPESADFATIGGFVLTSMGKVPGNGEEFTHDNVHFSVVRAEPRKINRLRIHVQREPQSA